jgi:hypothetical protein
MLGFNGGLMGVRRTPTTGAASGLWFQNEQSVAKRAAIWPTTGDLYWSDVSLLLHMDGSNGSTTFTDSSSNAFTITASGNAQISTDSPKFGTGSLTLDGNGDYLSTPADAKFALGTGDYTVECWVYVNSGNTNDGLFTFGSESEGLAVAIVNGQWTLNFSGSSGLDLGAVTTGAWQHLAVTRSGSSARMFIDGTQLGSTLSNSTNHSTNQLRIGYYYTTSFAINAKIDEFRVTKGVARYTANFTAPTAAFPDA